MKEMMVSMGPNVTDGRPPRKRVTTCNASQYRRVHRKKGAGKEAVLNEGCETHGKEGHIKDHEVQGHAQSDGADEIHILPHR